MRGFRGKLAVILAASGLMGIGRADPPPRVISVSGTTVTGQVRVQNAAPRQVADDFLRRTQSVAVQYNEFDHQLMNAYGRGGVTLSLVGGQALTERLASLPALPEGNIDRISREAERQHLRQAAQACLMQSPQKETNQSLLADIAQVEGSGPDSTRMTQLREDLHRQEIFYLRLQSYIGNGPGQLVQLLRGLSYGLNLTQQEREILGMTELRDGATFTQGEVEGRDNETAFTLREAQPQLGQAFDDATAHRRFRDSTAAELLGPRWRGEIENYHAGLREAQSDALSWLQRERALLSRVESRLQELRRQYQEELARVRNLSPERLSQYQSRVAALRNSLRECIDRTSLAILMQQVAPTVPAPSAPASPENPTVADNTRPASRDSGVAGDGSATGSSGSAGAAR